MELINEIVFAIGGFAIGALFTFFAATRQFDDIWDDAFRIGCRTGEDRERIRQLVAKKDEELNMEDDGK